MDKVTRAAQMRQMDQDAMKGAFAIAPEVLMENAGHEIGRASCRERVSSPV